MKKNSGQGLVEYIIIVALIAVVAIVAVKLLGTHVSKGFNNAAEKVAVVENPG